MEIHRCLFWIRSHQVTAVLYRAKRFAVMPFDGDKTIPLTPAYWEKWKAYRGFCHDDRADVCFISDEPLAECLPLSDCFCPKSESVWYIDKVKEAIAALSVYKPMKIFSESRRLLLRMDNRIRKLPEEELPDAEDAPVNEMEGQEVLSVTGNSCPRGDMYARTEVVNPVRTVTSSVLVTGGQAERTSVKTAKPIPKGMIFDVMKEIDSAVIAAPVKIGDVVIAGTAWGRVKAMFNERNQRIEKAGPAEPAIILGLNGAPTAGDSFHVMESEQEAREIANKRIQLQREQSLRTTTKLGLDELSHRIALGEFHELNIIVKGDTDGSIEALSDSFIKLSTEKVQVNVISKAVGQISENDVMLASASQAIIVGFQVRPSADARKLAEREGVEINTYSIIYDAIDEVKSTMQGMLDKVKKEIVSGEIEVKQVFKISKVGTVAGGLVTEGKVHNKDKARVIRDGIVIHTAPIDALKRYKDDAKEVATGLECGISLVNFNDIQVGDIIETFTEVEVEQKL